MAHRRRRALRVGKHEVRQVVVGVLRVTCEQLAEEAVLQHRAGSRRQRVAFAEQIADAVGRAAAVDVRAEADRVEPRRRRDVTHIRRREDGHVAIRVDVRSQRLISGRRTRAAIVRQRVC